MALDEHQRESQDCWPHQRTLKEYVGCSTRGIQRYLAELVRENLVIVERICAGGRNRYRLFHNTHATPVSSPHDNLVATHATPVSSHKANREMNPNNPLTPASGGTACALCLDSLNRIQVRMVNEPGQPMRRMWCPQCGGKRRTA
jgi:hypothetical protein